MLEGRGLFYGAFGPLGRNRLFTHDTWDAACRQAQEWGMRYVHPKVADGGYWWYADQHGNPDAQALSILRDVAQAHDLVCVPYHYCYGNKFGALQHEADICALLGRFFGAVCPDMEVEWAGQPNWGVDFGKRVKSQQHGLIFPTLWGNPAQHQDFPWAQVLPWVDGWLPMVYFSEWTDKAGAPFSAQEAIGYVYPQWEALDQHLTGQGVQPKPILPLIELGQHVPAQEVHNWLVAMQGYGYCGFWYDGTYAPYAETVKAAPLPSFHKPELSSPSASATTSATPAATTTTTTTIYDPGALDGPGLMSDQGDPTMHQNLSEADLLAVWRRNNAQIPFDLTHALPKNWAFLLQRRPDLHIGAPLSDEITWSAPNGEQYAVLPLDTGDYLYYNKHTGTTFLTGGKRV